MLHENEKKCDKIIHTRVRINGSHFAICDPFSKMCDPKINLFIKLATQKLVKLVKFNTEEVRNYMNLRFKNTFPICWCG